jgi:hypothetical protein
VASVKRASTADDKAGYRAELIQRVVAHELEQNEEPLLNERIGSSRPSHAQWRQFRDANINVIGLIMESLEQEHKFLYALHYHPSFETSLRSMRCGEGRSFPLA